MNKEDLKFIDNLPSPKKRKGHKVTKRTAYGFASVLVILVAITVSGALLTMFATLNTDVTVSETAITVSEDNINWYNAPYTFEKSFSADPGENITTWLNFTTSLDNIRFAVDYDVTAPEGITVVLKNYDGYVIEPTTFHVTSVPDNGNITIEYHVSPLIESGTFDCPIVFTPAGYVYI